MYNGPILSDLMQRRRMDLMEQEDVLRAQLNGLRGEHRALDDEISALSGSPLADQLAIRRLKKRKLHLKDEIKRIEDALYPDIIA